MTLFCLFCYSACPFSVIPNLSVPILILPVPFLALFSRPRRFSLPPSAFSILAPGFLPNPASCSLSPSSQPPALSCIIPLFNQLDYTRRMLSSLRATLPPGLEVEIILVDDASSDGTREWLRGTEALGCKILLNPNNLGYAASNNLGAQAARGEILALLNNDLVFEPGWLEPMLKLIHSLGQQAGIVGNIQFLADAGSLDHAGIEAMRDGKLRHVTRLPGTRLPDEMDILGSEIFAVTGACCLVRRDVFLSTGGFNLGFVNGGEDVDLCLRLAAEGRPCQLCSASRVIHQVGASRGKTSVMNERNSRLLYSLHTETITRRIAAAWLDASQPSPASNPEQAQLLARSAVWREQARWASLFDKPTEEPPLHALSWRGFHRRNTLPPVWIKRQALLVLPAGKPVRNLFLSGHLSPFDPAKPGTQGPLGLRVTINQLQVRCFDPLPEGHFNLCIEQPASLPDRPTKVLIEVLHCPDLLPPWCRHLADLIPGMPGRRLSSLCRRHKNRRLHISRIVADDVTALDCELECKVG